MSSRNYDVIVLGAGGVGAAALWQFAQRGVRVLGLDRFAPPHELGSSHGQTRIIRQAYFEHADYVPLLLESYRLWEELERFAGVVLKRETGLIEVGPADGVVVPGVRQAAQLHGLAVETLDGAEIERRWPALRVPAPLVGAFEPRAGVLYVEKCVAACLDAARRAGAEVRTNVEALDWSTGDDIRVRTTAGEFHAARLVVTAGPWAGPLLHDLIPPLEVRRKVVLWHEQRDAPVAADHGFPCFLFELSTGVFYGFPAIDQRGLKVGEHSGGEPIAEPLRLDRALRETDRRPVEAFLAGHIPAVAPRASAHAACMYTMSPDEHFVVDRHPADPRVVFAAGLSGHGFKFAPVLGQALADLALDGATSQPIEFLSLARFAG